MRALFLCDRDADGRVVVGGDGWPAKAVTAESLFREHWEFQGLRPDLIERLWREAKGDDT